MSNKPHKNKHNITKISAHSEPKSNLNPETKSNTTTKSTDQSAPKAQSSVAMPAHQDNQHPKKKSRSTERSAERVAKRAAGEEKPLREVFLLARPFVGLGRYLRDSWREIRQVRWPNRKATWKMTIAVLIYCAIFFAFILLLDTLFTFLFNLLLGLNK